MTILPAPVVTTHEGFNVVRDDLLPGGTKRRAIHVLFDDCQTYVYASPVYGYAQVALAYACKDYGKKAVIFCAQRKVWHPLTLEAMTAGALILEVPHGYMTVVRSRAREYCEATGACLLPFGLNDSRFVVAMSDVARSLPIPQPAEVWSVVGSGALMRALQMAWPGSRFYGVRVGAEPLINNAYIYMAPERYEQAAKDPPPFPSCGNYDAKCWRFIKAHASPGALFWNVGK